MSKPKRVELIEHLPLESPFSVHVFVSHVCDFKCEYCLHSLSGEQLKSMDFRKEQMTYDVFIKLVDEAKKFNTIPKSVIFAGHGEPLTHPKIAEMIRYAKIQNIADRVEIVTNGSQLNRELSDSLIESGLSRLRVSIQGLSSEVYRKICGRKVDFDELVSGVRYFYENKQETNVFVKIIDSALSSPGDAERFHALFDHISDEIAVEHLFPFVNQINHDTLDMTGQLTKHGDGAMRHVDICAMPFYMLVVWPNGDVTGCCATQPPIIFGNILKDSLFDIWHGRIRRDFLAERICGRVSNLICKSCTVPDYGMQTGDYLDAYRRKLNEIFCVEDR